MLVEEYLAWLVERCGYRDPRYLGGGRCAYIIPKIYTHAIAMGRVGDLIGVGECWCYETYDAARAALDAWDGLGEPKGWIRHPDSGRRLARAPGERDEEGNLVPLGATYVRF